MEADSGGITAPAGMKNLTVVTQIASYKALSHPIYGMYNPIEITHSHCHVTVLIPGLIHLSVFQTPPDVPGLPRDHDESAAATLGVAS